MAEYLDQNLNPAAVRPFPRTLYSLVAAVALALSAIIGYTTYLGISTQKVLMPLLNAVHTIRTEATMAHLWSEEVLEKDPDASIEEVWGHYDRAASSVAFLINRTANRNTLGIPINDPELIRTLKLLQAQLTAAREITIKRFELRGSAGIGTEIDHAYDKAYRELIRTSVGAETRLDRFIEKYMRTFYTIQIFLVLISLLLFLISGVAIFRFDRRRMRDAGTIGDQNRQLIAANQQLYATEQQLRASNQQLVAGEQQLRASNQQLIAGEQQLRATNQQLMASEQALSASEARYRSLFADMAEGVALHHLIYDAEGRPADYVIIDVNLQYEKILGINRDTVIGKTATEIYGTTEAPYLADFTRVAETGVPYRFETYFPPMKKHFSISVSPIEKGHFATIFTDITNQKKAADLIMLNQERLAALWEISQYKAASEMELLDFALEKAIRLTNSKIGYIYHYNEERREFVLNTWSKGVMKECQILEKKTIYSLDKTGIWGEAVRQGKPIILNDYQSPHPLKKGCPEGHAPLSRYMTIPVKINDRIVAVVGVANSDNDYDDADVTQLSLLMHSVWQILARMTAEDERQYMETQMQKLESLGVLAGGIAHDFNNLLTAIMANVNLASLQMKPGDRLTERMTEAEKACLRAQDLTQQLLTFARGGAPIKKITPLVNIITEAAQFALRGTNVKSELILCSDLAAVEADPGQISQVINNLMLNAAQAMPEGGLITVSAENTRVVPENLLPLSEGDYVKISIQDRGIGMPKELLRKIFDPYFTTKQKGSGLGLAVTYSIINRHNGHITVDSAPGAGACFQLFLPAAAGQQALQEHSAEPLIRGKGRVLVMDDEEMVCNIAREILSEIGYEISIACDGQEALELYGTAQTSGIKFDLVIMDLTIPGGIGGREAVKKLLALDPEARVIVSSGYSNDPIMSDYQDYGFRGVITKPYRVADLAAAVHRALHRNP
ncbi:MAG: hypothetical protein C0402_11020 [Thermodesulfovibrio sp.]|nr:hypothetical protein [Thermodesulfovibrio sp.]